LVTITTVCIAALAFAVWFSKRSSIGKEMALATAGNAPMAVETKAKEAPAKVADPVVETTEGEDK